MRRPLASSLCWLLLASGCAWAPASDRPGAPGWQSEKVADPGALLKETLSSAEAPLWPLERRSAGFRAHGKIDGLLVAAPGSGLRVRTVRRRDGHHRLLVGREGNPGRRAAQLPELLAGVSKVRWHAYRLTSPDGEQAVLFVPQGARFRLYRRDEGAILEADLPWEPEEEDPFEPLDRLRLPVQ